MRAVLAIACAVVCVGPSPALAQTPVVATVERLSFDRPEAWALKYFTSVTLLGGLTAPAVLPVGSVDVGADVAWVPRLSQAQRRVGFNGTKEEDLNKAPVFGRPTVRIGLPWRLGLTLAGNPPIETFGVTPKLFAIGLERPWTRGEWTAGWRAAGQVGTVTGAYTCPARVLAFPPGSSNNSYGCEAASTDSASLRYLSGEMDVAKRLSPQGRVTPHASVLIAYMTTAFQVNARTFGYLDHTRLEARGVTVALTAGADVAVTRRIGVSAAAFYSPLSVKRTFDGPRTVDGLFNVRVAVTYRVRG